MSLVKLQDLPEEERPREKLLTRGVGSLSNGELLAILLHSGTREKSALDLANEILAHMKDFDIGTLLLNPNLLGEVKGVGPAKLATVMAAIEIGLRLAQKPSTDRVVIRTPAQAANYAMPILRYKSKEHFHIMLLDTKKQLIAFPLISVGTLNASIVHPREVFRTALEYAASTIILCHNHPSGDATPSEEDINITNRLIEAGRILSVEVIDHIIIGDNKYTSLKSENMVK